MQIENIFLKVLTQYFLEVLKVERKNTNSGTFHIPIDNVFFYLNDLEYYFKESELLRICEQYFTKINKKIKNKVLKKYPNLECYFKEHFWKNPKKYSLKTTNAHYSRILTDPNQLIFSETLQNPIQTTSGYRSSETKSNQNSPDGSRCNSPLPEENVDIFRNLQNEPFESRAGSPIPKDNILFNDERNTSNDERNSFNDVRNSFNDVRNTSNDERNTSNDERICSRENKNRFRKKSKSSKQLYNLRQTQNFTTRQNNVQTKRKYCKRLKLYPYMNQLPDTLPFLKPNESTLLLQAINGSDIDDLNVPLPICKTIFKQCRKVNPVTKRYTPYEDDGSENIPFHITLKY